MKCEFDPYVPGPNYLWFEPVEDDQVIGFNGINSTVEYSFDKQNWQEFEYDEDGAIMVTVPYGTKIYCRGINPDGVRSTDLIDESDWSTDTFWGDGLSIWNIGGDIMTLIDYTDPDLDTMVGTFYSLFSQGTDHFVDLYHTNDLILSADVLSDRCYVEMFSESSNLELAPDLPATTLAQSCYSNMFSGCTSLTTAPELPVTTLAQSCYSNMFNGCTSLTTAPDLPATTLATDCYSSMFHGCTNLTTAPDLPAITLASYCYSNMFNGCTSLIEAPELPATTLASYCYSAMFYNCPNLNYIKCLATDISATDCTRYWVSGVSSTGTFIKNSSMSSWIIGSSDGIPSNWTVQNA